MQSPEHIGKIRGASELAAWYGRFPDFREAIVTEFQISGDGQGHLLAEVFRMTDEVDEKGFFINDRHGFVTLRFSEILTVELRDFLPGQAILSGLEFSIEGETFVASWSSSYGLDGVIKSKRLSISHVSAE